MLCTIITVVAIISTFFGTESTAKVFTSSAFYVVYGLLCLNFLFCTWKHLTSAKRNTAFVLIHMGVLLVIAGASFGHFRQTKGFLTLNQQSEGCKIYGELENGEWGLLETLPFTVFLDRFWIQYYPRGDELKLYMRVYENLDATHAQEPGLSLPIGESPGVEGMLGDVRLKVEEIYPKASVTKEEKGDHLLLVELKESGEWLSFPIILREPIRIDQLQTIITPMAIYRDAKVRMQGGLMEASDEPNNPAVEIELEATPGSKPVKKYLFALWPDGLGSMMGDHRDNESPFIFESEDYHLVYRPPEVIHTVTPGGEDGTVAVRISAAKNDESVSEWYYPNHDPLPRYHILFDGLVVEVLDLNPPRISDFKSKLTILEEGEMVVSKVVEVNHPLTYKGYTFYQHSYDQEGERYTVLQVVKDPGLWLVMAGLAFLMLGVIQKFYVYPLFRARNKEGK